MQNCWLWRSEKGPQITDSKECWQALGHGFFTGAYGRRRSRLSDSWCQLSETSILILASRTVKVSYVSKFLIITSAMKANTKPGGDLLKKITQASALNGVLQNTRLFRHLSCSTHGLWSSEWDFCTYVSCHFQSLVNQLYYLDIGAAVVKLQISRLSPAQSNLVCKDQFMRETVFASVTAAESWCWQAQTPTLTSSSLPGALISDSQPQWVPVLLIVLQGNDSQLLVDPLLQAFPHMHAVLSQCHRASKQLKKKSCIFL